MCDSISVWYEMGERKGAPLALVGSIRINYTQALTRSESSGSYAALEVLFGQAGAVASVNPSADTFSG
jgi:hypothetical protein